MNRSTIVLNMNYEYMNTINWQKAVTLVFQNKVDVIAWHDDVVSNSSKSFEMFVPKIIRLVNLVRRIYKNKVPYSKRNVFTRDNFTCCYCDVKMPLEECTVDHVVPKAHGGLSEWENCVCSCQKCNHSKGDIPLEKCGKYLNRTPHQPTISEFIYLKMKNNGIDKYVKEILDDLVKQ